MQTIKVRLKKKINNNLNGPCTLINNYTHVLAYCYKIYDT